MPTMNTATTRMSRKFRWMPGRLLANSPAQTWMPFAAVDRREVVGGEPADRVGAERVERDVAEVEQAGEADDDVQAQRHDDVGAGE